MVIPEFELEISEPDLRILTTSPRQSSWKQWMLATYNFNLIRLMKISEETNIFSYTIILKQKQLTCNKRGKKDLLDAKEYLRNRLFTYNTYSSVYEIFNTLEFQNSYHTP